MLESKHNVKVVMVETKILSILSWNTFTKYSYCILAVRDCDETLCNGQGSCRRKIYSEDIYCFCNEHYSGDHCETAHVINSKLFIQY